MNPVIPNRWRALRIWISMIGGVGLCLAPAWAQTTPPPALNPPADTASLPTLPAGSLTPAVPDNYLIGPNDLIAVTVFGMPDLSALVRVQSTGQFSLPLLSRPIVAAQHTAPQVAAELTAELEREGLAVRPSVRVTVEQVLSKPVVVSGAVRTPTVIQATRQLRLIEAISAAGGVTAAGGGSVVLTQNGKDTTYDLNALLNTSNPPPTPMLQGGETIRVLPARLIYVVGALQKPGAFPITTGEPVSVLKAVALAQGLSQSDPPDKKHAQILRTQPDGAKVAIPVDLNSVLQHKAPDPQLEAGDVLYVPDSGRQRFLRALVQDAGQTVVIALGYSTHY